MTNPVLEAALQYARLGMAVFPCKSKRPTTPAGFKDASTSRDVIKSMVGLHLIGQFHLQDLNPLELTAQDAHRVVTGDLVEHQDRQVPVVTVASWNLRPASRRARRSTG